MIFGEHSDIVENDFLTMQRFLDISRFLYSGGWQVCLGSLTNSKIITGYGKYSKYSADKSFYDLTELVVANKL